jgi:DNA-binding response OmpR family regulator
MAKEMAIGPGRKTPNTDSRRYLAMPFTKSEVLARLRAIETRLQAGIPAEDRCTFTLTVRWVTRGGEPTSVTWMSKRRTGRP